MEELKLLLEKAEPWIIGLWRFREAGKPKLWCATYCVNGCYYDVTGKRTLEKVLREVISTAKKLEAKVG